MKKSHILKSSIAVFFLSTLLLTACNTEEKKTEESKEVAEEVNEDKFNTKASEKDAQFVVDATSASFDEIRIADVALAKSKNAEVKKIAHQLKDEHSAMITELNSVASKSAITVPAVASDDASKWATRLMDTDVKDFDKNWLERVEDMHEASVKKYEDASNNAADTNIKTWASTTLIKIRAHLDMINKTQDMMK